MADDPCIEMVEAVKDFLNEGEWSQEFEAVRCYDLTSELKDDGVVHVDLAVEDDSGAIETRGSTENQIGVAIAVRKKCDVDNLAEMDALMLLMLEFKDSLLATRLATTTYGDAWCHSWERNPAYYRRHIKDFRQFTSLLILQFQLSRAIP